MRNDLAYTLCNPVIFSLPRHARSTKKRVNLSGGFVFPRMPNDGTLSAFGCLGWRSIEVVQHSLGSDKVISHLMGSTSESQSFIGMLYCHQLK